ncbi:hypothetical protein NLX83_38070 [Allokutzneria sp. A3M-2-11 16]|uniref:hypothetical protein n=1 Tax=Allokutzneria sp. A3M-2-11 16 TaxID=2962043 RepID=UPI0020B8414A|nr:hypothetical protein [Allokutzneria sp. A3M-2-11 16]MCP3805088.1 hypothetical protein [Allokutzneria sp. A3M-2-11 16]
MATPRITALFAVAAVFTVLAGCASAAEALRDDANEICGTVRHGVSKLPKTGPDDSRKQVVPRLDTQLSLARTAEKQLGELRAEGDDQWRLAEVRASWRGTVAALQELRDTWEDPYRAGSGSEAIPRRPGSDTLVALTISMVRSRAEAAVDKLAVAADTAGFTECGERITWRL